MPAVTISATEVQPTSWSPQIEAIGTLRAAQGVNVAVEAAGTVNSIAFEANDRVNAGDLLVQIDDAVERAELTSAQADIERDRAQLERARRLRESGVTAESNLEDAQTAFAASESAMARIQAVLDQKAVVAPFSGTIGIPRIDVGEYVQPGTIIATLQQLDTMKVDFTVPEQLVGELSIGQQARFGLTEADFPYEGKIVGIDPKIDPQTRLVSVRAEVDNPDGALRPGQFARVRVELPPLDGIIAVPQTAVVTSLYGDYVYVVEPAESPEGTAPNAGDAAGDGAGEETLVAKQVFVELGRRQGNQVEIAKGLEAGQTVITSGQNKLANNTPVKIDNTVDPAVLSLDAELRP